MANDPLKPCPCCGAAANYYPVEWPPGVWRRTRSQKEHIVCCSSCFLQVSGETAEEAWEKWNRREDDEWLSEEALSRLRCAACGDRVAREQWRPSVCAAGNPRDILALCGECDYRLNAIILEFFNVEGREAVIAEYRRRKGLDEDGQKD